MNLPEVSNPGEYLMFGEADAQGSGTRYVDFVGDEMHFSDVARNAGYLGSNSAIQASASVGSYDSLSGVWTIGNLASGGSATLTLTIAVRPSRMSSPWRFSSFSLRRPLSRA